MLLTGGPVSHWYLHIATLERTMCPACIATSAILVAGTGTAGGFLALCLTKFRHLFRANRLEQKATEI
jgi:hypothetical protein